ncbi:MAG: FAD-dependent oxidoreductase [Clostridia bacterium]|nr:FAD-dependent oxidoreductase [Clostridia bacterium]
MSKLNLISKGRDQRALEAIRSDIVRRLPASQQGICPVDMAASFANVCAAQSCGKCVPCRIGLAKIGALIDKILDGKGSLQDIDLIEKTALAAIDSADCAIGYDAGRIVYECVKAFRDDFESHINSGWCSARAEHPVPCSSLCPAQVDIPGYIALVNAGRYADAVRIIRKDNPFPSVCGLICEHPCEEGCRRNMIDDAINIRGLKRYAVEKAGYVPAEKVTEAPTGKRVAVIGGGPSGLSAAYFLALMGHEVEVFEKRKYAGGMLRYGIPSYRLPREILQQDIDVILETGVKLHLESDIGTVEDIRKLTDSFDATFISIGAHTDNKLRIPGADLGGVVSAVKLLRGIGDGEHPDFTGKKVAIIGGGNVAMDAARSSIRLGAEKVSIVYRRRREDMTALSEEIDGAVAEGCELLTMMAPARIEGNADDEAVALWMKPQLIGVIGKDGRPSISGADAPEEKLDVDIVIVAIGQAVESAAFGEFGLPLKWDTLAADSACEFEGIEGVFAGGDCATGPATVIKAIAAAKVAAHNIDQYLGFNHEIGLDIEIPAPSLFDRPACGRVIPKEREAAQRKNDFSLMEFCMSEQEACQESARCLRCDHFGYGKFRGGRCEKW